MSPLILKLDAGNVLTLKILGLEDTSEHYFGVTAYDAAGNESVYSNIVHSPEAEEEFVLPLLEFEVDIRILQ
jgi:ribulose bisphosphate carboxylase small subunit